MCFYPFLLRFLEPDKRFRGGGSNPLTPPGYFFEESSVSNTTYIKVRNLYGFIFNRICESQYEFLIVSLMPQNNQ